MKRPYECRVTSHGKRQLELQLTCPLPEKQKRTSYHLSVYLLFPQQLQMTGNRYGEQNFLNDILSYTRFSTPAMSLRNLSDMNNTKSSLTRLISTMNGAHLGSELNDQRVQYELKTLVNIFKSRAKETQRMIAQNLNRNQESPDALPIASAFLTDSDEVLHILREKIRPLFLEPHIPAVLRSALDFCDEALSLSTEKHLFEILELFKNNPGRESIYDDIIARLRRERNHRASRGFSTILNANEDASKEAFLNQESTLKKWAQQTYYMTKERARSVRHITSLFMAVAAMAAMVFAVTAAILAGRYFPQNSIPFALVLVISYAFKDRIKETLRGFFLHALPRLVSDRRDKLIAPDGGAAGSSQLRVSVGTERGVSKELRNLFHLAERNRQIALPERDVLQFHKRIHLRSARLRKRYSRLEAISEILRFRMDDWLAYMDDPRERVWYLDGDEPRPMTINRTYPISMILQLSDPRADRSEIYSYELLLNRKGIVQVKLTGRM